MAILSLIELIELQRPIHNEFVYASVDLVHVRRRVSMSVGVLTAPYFLNVPQSWRRVK